jgi:hypothetical protein
MGQFDAPSFLPPGLGLLSRFFAPAPDTTPDWAGHAVAFSQTPVSMGGTDGAGGPAPNGTTAASTPPVSGPTASPQVVAAGAPNKPSIALDQALLPSGASGVDPTPLWGRLAPTIASNASTLMALGGGLAGARTWGEGINKGLTQAAQTSLEQQKLEQARRSQGSVFTTLRTLGVPPELALLAAQNPQALRWVLARYGGPQRE